MLRRAAVAMRAYPYPLALIARIRSRTATVARSLCTAAKAAATAAALAVATTACNAPERDAPAARAGAAIEAAAAAAPPAKAATGPRFVAGPATGDLAVGVAAAMAASSAEQRLVLVYVGATWCEPCQRFHHAVEGGELSGVAALSRITFLEFDLDRDRDRLAAAGYESKYIPLFALPGPGGRSSGKQVEGSVKGEGAVSHIVPRLTTLLEL